MKQRTPTERMKQIAQLYYNEKLTMQEISTTLRINKSTVSRTIQRYKELLSL